MKKLIKKYLKKKLVRIHPKKFLFLRWLADIVMDKKKNEDVCHSIAYWFNDNPNFKGVVNDVFTIDNEVYLYTTTPGIWIGRSGSTYDEVSKFINSDVNGNIISDYHINLIEMDYSVPFNQVYRYLSYIRNNY